MLYTDRELKTHAREMRTARRAARLIALTNSMRPCSSSIIFSVLRTSPSMPFTMNDTTLQTVPDNEELVEGQVFLHKQSPRRHYNGSQSDYRIRAW